MTTHTVGLILTAVGMVGMAFGLFHVIGIWWSLSLTGALSFVIGSLMLREPEQ